jgi:hypothetical protein
MNPGEPLTDWPETSLVDGPRVSGREAEYEALREWRDAHPNEVDAVLEVLTRDRRVVGCRVVRSSGDPELDRRAVALYEGAEDPGGGDGQAMIQVRVFGSDRSTPDESDWRD